MATSMKKKPSRSHDHTSNFDRNRDTNTNSFLTEERRLLKNPVTNPVSNKRISKFNTRANQMTSDQLDLELERRQLSTSGEMDIRRTRLKHHEHAVLTFGPNDNPLKSIEQPFEFIAVVDFEATCDEGERNNYKHEIIEFPIVLISVQEQAIVDQFRSYCRPVLKPVLSKFCTELTGIEQRQVKDAPVFADVLKNVEKWLNERNLLPSTNKPRLAFATDGPWDFANFLQMQCQLSSIPYPQWANQWINIRKHYSNFYGVRRCGIDKMLKQIGLNFDGRPHSGLDDSINIARIAIAMLKDGCILSLNDGIRDSNRTAEAKSESKDNEEDEDSIVFEN